MADAVDAITSDRPYRDARPFDEAAEELTRCSGTHFDPAIVQAFTEIPLDAWRELRHATTEPGMTVPDARSGREIRYSLLAMTGDRVLGEWA